MPFALLLAGALLLTVAIRNQQTSFVQLIRGDFTGPGNFMYWVVAILILGAIGYIDKARPVSNTLLVLILLVLILKKGDPNNVHGGVFQQLQDALGSTKSSTTLSSLVGTAVGAAETGVGAPPPGS